MNPSIVSYGLLALELCPGQHLAHPALPVAESAELGALMAADLKSWMVGHTGIDLSLAAAGFDPVEILRPGWPIHTEIARLAKLAPNSPEARLLCLGAHEGRMPAQLNPDPVFAQGPLRWLPFVLSGPADAMSELQPRLEADLLERGMAGAATALYAQTQFGVAIEHARYMTLNDGVAMMVMQYSHIGLEPVWPLIEQSLFAPDKGIWLDAPPEPLVFAAKGVAHIALFDCHQWLRLQPGLDAKSSEQLELMFQHYQMRQRQIAALLEAHGLQVEFDFCADAKTAHQTLLR